MLRVVQEAVFAREVVNVLALMLQLLEALIKVEVSL